MTPETVRRYLRAHAAWPVEPARARWSPSRTSGSSTPEPRPGEPAAGRRRARLLRRRLRRAHRRSGIWLGEADATARFETGLRRPGRPATDPPPRPAGAVGHRRPHLVGWTLAGLIWGVFWPLIAGTFEPGRRRPHDLRHHDRSAASAATVLVFFAVERRGGRRCPRTSSRRRRSPGPWRPAAAGPRAPAGDAR